MTRTRTSTLRVRGRAQGAGLGLALLWLTGCTGVPLTDPQDLAEAVFPAPEPRVRSAIVQVLSFQGYVVDQPGQAPTILRTGYRQEIRGPWDWVLTHGMGSGRSRVEAILEAEGNGATRVTFRVWSEGKEELFTAWRPYDPPLAQSAPEQLSQLRRVLSLP